MNDNQEKIKALQDRMDLLVQRQKTFIVELKQLRQEIRDLQVEDTSKTVEKAVQEEKKAKKTSTFFENYTNKKQPEAKVETHEVSDEEVKVKEPMFEMNLEKFIGENLISKIGILITIIGVAIGAKYSIDNDLISPLTRIVLGYLVGVGLLGFGIKLKEKYLNYSAVLVSGAIAIMYFITFTAYSFYGLFPQIIAFLLMVMFTVFTVVAAISYNKQVIAHIGLVGAYAVPFFLSNGSGDILTFFSYIAIINIGILVIGFKRYWKTLFYAAFVQTWLIFAVWFLMNSYKEEYFNLASIFATIFFVIFYITFLAYKLIRKENFNIGSVILLLINSFVYYGIGFLLLSEFSFGEDYLGLFTLGNGIIHFAVGSLIYKQKLFDKQLFYLVIGLVLIFITMAIPVQLDGNWVTLLWTTQAVLLFWIGRTKAVPFYEKIAYALIALSFFSIIDDWGNTYYNYNGSAEAIAIKPIFNVYFLTSILFIVAIAFINYLHRNTKYEKPAFVQNEAFKVIPNYGLGILLLVSIYIGFRVEISNYFDLLYQQSAILIDSDTDDYTYNKYNYNIRSYQNIWLMIYTMIFLIVLSFINIKKIKNTQLGIANIVLNTLIAVIFLTAGIYELGELQMDYFTQTKEDLYKIGSGAIGLRYLSFAFLFALLFASYQYIKTMFNNKSYKVIFETILSVIIIWLISFEFVIWMETSNSGASSKLGLSIIWGIYALLVIGFGIWKKKKHLRIAAIALFGITLVKLFLYDLAHLNTISKTIVLVALGILLLIISFLYNKYKDVISDGDE
jgi:hypothetical protein